MTSDSPPTDASLDGSEATDLAGRTLGGYRLIRHLGSGGMADVYLAEQTSLGRQVAVKVLRRETLRNRGAVERFEREARAAAALVHGAIVQIHEVTRIDGVHFLVTEYVEGPTLKAWLAARGTLDAWQALDVLAQVGAALVRASDQGIVHRDIKPENLLVTRAGEVKVADFGLAHVGTEDLALTQTGMTLGTPLYMSPEQGRGEAVDARSDLYSLGATVYHLLAGRPPFTGATGVRVAMAHMTEPVVPLSTVRPEVPAAVAGIVHRLLEKSPGDRYAGPRELVDAVEDAREALADGGRRPRSGPLAWEGGIEAWRPHPVGGAGSIHPEVTAATRALAAALTRVDTDHAVQRRRWFLTALAAALAAALGFVVGRGRSRRIERPRPP